MKKHLTEVISETFPEGLWFLLWYKDQQQWVPVRSTEYLQENNEYRVRGPFTGLEDALAAANEAATTDSTPAASPTNANQEISFIAKRSRSLLDEINSINYRHTPGGNRRRDERRRRERRAARPETAAEREARTGRDRREPADRRLPVDEQLQTLVQEFHQLMAQRTKAASNPDEKSS